MRSVRYRSPVPVVMGDETSDAVRKGYLRFSDEIEQLRIEERNYTEGNIIIDRLCNRLSALFDAKIIPSFMMPQGHWGVLPADWMTKRELQVDLRRGVPSSLALKMTKVPVMVAVDVAESVISREERYNAR